MTAQKVEMGLAPFGDVIVVVAVGYGGAHHEQQDLRQGMQNTAGVTRIVAPSEVIEQHRKARLLRWGGGGQWHRARLRSRGTA
jgi:hypothetical protein